MKAPTHRLFLLLFLLLAIWPTVKSQTNSIVEIKRLDTEPRLILDSLTQLINQKESNTDVQFHNIKFTISVCQDKLDKPKESIETLKEIEQLTEFLNLGPLFISSVYDRLGYLYYDINEIEHSIDYLQKAIQIRRQNSDINPRELAISYYNLARTYTDQVATYSECISYSDSSIAIFDSIPDPTSELVRAHMIKGVAYEGLDKLTNAKKSYDLAYKISKLFPEDKKVIININKNLGNYFLEIDDRSKALDYYNDALELSLKINGQNNYQTNSILQNIAYVMSLLKQFDEAIEINNQILKSNIELYGPRDYEVARIYQNLANTFSSKGDLDLAFEYFKKAEKLYVEILPPNSIDLAINHIQLGASYQEVGKYKEALKQYEKTLKIATKVLGKDHIIIAACEYYSANTLADMGQYDHAFEKYELTKELLGYNPKDQTKLKSFGKAADLFFNIGNTYSYWYEDTGIDSLLELAQVHYDEAIQLIDKARKKLGNQDSQEYLMSKYRGSYKSNLLNLYNLNEKGIQPTFDNMFSFIDQIKNTQLKDAALHKQAIKYSNIPIAVLDKGKGLVTEINDLQYKIEFLKTTGLDSLEKLTKTRSELKNVKISYIDYLKELELVYPSYYDLKYAENIVDMDYVKHELVSKSHAIINLFLEDDYLFIASLSEGFINVDTITLSNTRLSLLENCIASFNDINNSDWTKISYAAYATILQKSIEKLPKPITEITIIPDGILSGLPFEALVMDTEHLRLLQDDFVIRYAYSTTLLKQANQKKKSENKSVLAFVPNYDFLRDESNLSDNDDLIAGLVRDGNYDLPGSKLEVDNISKLNKTKVLAGPFATESNFNALSADYAVLHLSMHALINKNSPLDSKLMFSNKRDSSNDNQLHAYELYSMDIPADLVVLSACNTGIGKSKRGEGILSLSRGFTHAGVASTVMSLWKVPDDATSSIMSSFYLYLSENHTKSAALRLAKLDYLSSVIVPERKHPFFWAGFIVVGNDDPISLEKNSTSSFISLALGLLFVLLLLYYFRKR